MKGKSYWSVSPVKNEKRCTAGGIKIGFEDDTAYLGSFIGKTIGATLAVPSSVSKLDDTETWRYATLAFLLKAKNLSFISVWNPGFLMLLIESLDKEFQSLTDDIRRGCISNIDGRRESHAAILDSFGKADTGRASELDIIFQSGSPGNSLGKIWPDLKLISCWKDGAAAISAKNLGKYFPGTRIVGKGLISTEGFVSFPVSGASAPVLSVNSHFYEFIPSDAKDSTLFPWELESGGRYSVVITTGGGLYRYKLHDMVEVKGFYKSCPMLEFVERDNGTSDYHGEKLSESQVICALNEIFRSGIPEFAMLAPDGEPVPDHYTLFLAGQKDVPDKLPESLDKELRKNFHYNYCRELGQLKEPEIFMVVEGAAHAHRCYLRHFASEGISEGDIKPRVLDSDKNWKYVFIGK